jgi:hypothetical protein
VPEGGWGIKAFEEFNEYSGVSQTLRLNAKSLLPHHTVPSTGRIMILDGSQAVNCLATFI